MLRSVSPLKRRSAARGLSVGVLAAVVGAGAAPAAEFAWVVRVDPEASSIRWTLGATLHTVEGTVPLGDDPYQLEVDPATGRASGRLAILSAGLASGNARRDRKMHREVVESGRFPEIAFVAERFVGALPPSGGEARVELAGRLEIHGSEMPLAVPATVRFAADGGWSAEAAFDVPYVELGMKDPSTFVLRVEKSVRVELELAGTVAPAGD